jgi:hypothetical protein
VLTHTTHLPPLDSPSAPCCPTGNKQPPWCFTPPPQTHTHPQTPSLLTHTTHLPPRPPPSCPCCPAGTQRPQAPQHACAAAPATTEQVRAHHPAADTHKKQQWASDTVIKVIKRLQHGIGRNCTNRLVCAAATKQLRTHHKAAADTAEATISTGITAAANVPPLPGPLSPRSPCTMQEHQLLPATPPPPRNPHTPRRKLPTPKGHTNFDYHKRASNAAHTPRKQIPTAPANVCCWLKPSSGMTHYIACQVAFC